MKKILACITPQTNGHRIIDRAAAEAEREKGELHVLNIQKGGNIFFNDDSAELLEELFAYGRKKGGDIHALAGDDVPRLIYNFVIKNEIAKIVVGEHPDGVQASEILEKLSGSLDRLKIEIIVLEREK